MDFSDIRPNCLLIALSIFFLIGLIGAFAQEKGPEQALLSALRAKEKELKQKESEIERKKEELEIIKEGIEKRIEELKKLRDEINVYFSKMGKMKEKHLEELARIYASTSPQEAARIIEQLNTKIAAKIMFYMNKRKAGAIWTYVSPKRACEITEEMARLK